MSKKDEWIGRVEKSLDGLERAEARPYLYSRVMAGLGSDRFRKVPAKLVWVAGCSLLLLLLVNLAAIRRGHRPRGNGLQPLEAQLRLMNNNIITYN